METELMAETILQKYNGETIDRKDDIILYEVEFLGKTQKIMETPLPHAPWLTIFLFVKPEFINVEDAWNWAFFQN